MSLYIGKNSTNTGGLLHITNNIESEEVLKNSITDNTVFHSSLPYLNLVDSREVTINRSVASDGYSIKGIGTSYTGLITATIPSDMFQYFNNDYLVIIACSSSNSNNIPSFTSFPARAVYNNSYYNNYSRYTGSSRTFTNSPYVPVGGGYYNSNYANLLAMSTSNVADSNFKYLVLSVGNSGNNPYDAIFLQTSGGLSQIDNVNPIGTAYVFKISKSHPYPGYNGDLSVMLDRNNFIISGSGNVVDLENHSFVKYSSLEDSDIKYIAPRSNTKISGLSIFNKDKIPAIGWDINFESSNFYIKKITQSNGAIPIIDSSTNYMKCTSVIDIPINISHPGDYSLPNFYSYVGSYSMCIVLISVTCVIGGISVDIPSHYQVVFNTNYTTNTLSTSSVSVTNNQGGKTARVCKFTTTNSSNGLVIGYSSYLSGNIYNISANVYGTINIIVFK